MNHKELLEFSIKSIESYLKLSNEVKELKSRLKNKEYDNLFKINTLISVKTLCMYQISESVKNQVILYKTKTI